MFTLRAACCLASWGDPAAQASYSPNLSTNEHGDVPDEMLVYTQSSGDIPRAPRQASTRPRRQSGSGNNQPIVVDSVDGYTWPWAWYLRNYKDVAYATITQGYTPPRRESGDFVGKPDAPTSTSTASYGEGIPYHHRRWFPEEYRGRTASTRRRTSSATSFSKSSWSTGSTTGSAATRPGRDRHRGWRRVLPEGLRHRRHPPPAGPTVAPTARSS